jgi:hypothetical protein
MSQPQLEALHQDQALKEEKYWLGYEAKMTSAELHNATSISTNGRWKTFV